MGPSTLAANNRVQEPSPSLPALFLLHPITTTTSSNYDRNLFYPLLHPSPFTYKRSPPSRTPSAAFVALFVTSTSAVYFTTASAFSSTFACPARDITGNTVSTLPFSVCYALVSVKSRGFAQRSSIIVDNHIPTARSTSRNQTSVCGAGCRLILDLHVLLLLVSVVSSLKIESRAMASLLVDVDVHAEIARLAICSALARSQPHSLLPLASPYSFSIQLLHQVSAHPL